MAFLKTSDSIIIKATLTEEGRKLLARGKFRISKFALGDDEVDYELIDPKAISDGDYLPAMENTKLFEAYGNKDRNIQWGLNSYDSGILYLNASEREFLIDRVGVEGLHASLLYIPTLKQNDKLDISPTISSSFYYLSVNDETSEKLISIAKTINEADPTKTFNFLAENRKENCKIVVESGISNLDPDKHAIELCYPSGHSREEFILKKHLLDNDYLVYADDRFIEGVHGIKRDSKFLNYQSGETIINLKTDKNTPAISYSSEFPNYAARIFQGIQNLMYDYPPGPSISFSYSAHDGPRGTIVALNPVIKKEMMINSTSTTDLRFARYGETEQVIFSELPLDKFDYIDTTIYILGATSNTRVVIPVRIIRYAGK